MWHIGFQKKFLNCMTWDRSVGLPGSHDNYYTHSDHTLLMVIANNNYDNHYGISGVML